MSDRTLDSELKQWVLDQALAALTTVDKRAYGWIGFEFCAYSFGAEAQVGDGQQLAHLIVPTLVIGLGGTAAMIRRMRANLPRPA